MRNTALAVLQEAAYKYQDFLDAFFSVAVTRNRGGCGGLGTYASWSSDNTCPRGLATLVEHAIAHFTGPFYPSMSSVLNKSLYPWLSKPWGY